ncbi:MAG: peptidoglycan DD-metalloendopeptidase family protein [Deltaproteobacteria bacterium]|nr:peptidoglycan DD-metalloendopeptidase family protein [Deltaproteobacteria bacterium]
MCRKRPCRSNPVELLNDPPKGESLLRRGLLKVFLAWLLATGSILSVESFGHGAAPGKGDTEKRIEQIEKLETDLSREMKQLLKFGEKEKELLGQLSLLERDIGEKKRTLKEIQTKLRQGKVQLGTQKEQLRGLEGELERIEGRLCKRLVAFYKYAKRGYIHLLATSSGLDQLRKRIKYLYVLTEEDRRLFKEVRSLQMAKKRAIEEVEEKVGFLEGLEKEEMDRMASLKKDLEKKVILLMKIHREREFYETAVRELQLGARDLRNTLRDLEKKSGTSDQLPAGFTKAKGKLKPPLEGKILRDIGPLGAGYYGSRKGIYILAKANSEVKAIFPGRVEYSGWLKGYGQIIVINHGSRHFSVSAYLSERFKKKGDLVEGGEVIGALGKTGPVAGPMLYFEIRKGSTSLTPMKWLKVN